LTQFPALVHSLQIPCHSTSPTATASGSSLDAYSSDSSEEEILDPEVSVATCCSQSRAATVALPAELVPALQAFVRRLKSKSSLHIVWYDSVITDGQLLWQKQHFLIAAGSILLNYCWTADLLKSTAGRLAELQSSSSSALTVYVGVDCFGRGCPGGGGFNCSEAVRMIVENQQLGVGLFAPGWAYETCRSAAEPDEAMETPRTFGRVWTLEFWAGMTPLLGEPRPLAGRRLNTAFCLGQGVCKWDRGRLVSTNAWNSLWEAHPMPHYWLCGAEQHLSLCRSRAWQGGGCLRVALSGGVGGGIGGNGGCELPLFHRVRALKLVYSLDSVFEDRPLDPVTVCLVAKYRRHSSSVDSIGGGAQRQQQQQLIVLLCHSTSAVAAAAARLCVFPRTVRREVEVEGDAYSEAGGRGWPRRGRVAHGVHRGRRPPLWSIAITKTPAMLTKTAYWNSCGLFFILPSRLESTETVEAISFAFKEHHRPPSPGLRFPPNCNPK
uniref:Mannosyl-glycoprotein endo-beta-N-acetylglucosaminidase n=1 Tax=Macrostomum lignano TaxID=282301 RepID=A0A1I8JMV4_9PLAT